MASHFPAFRRRKGELFKATEKKVPKETQERCQCLFFVQKPHRLFRTKSSRVPNKERKCPGSHGGTKKKLHRVRQSKGISDGISLYKSSRVVTTDRESRKQRNKSESLRVSCVVKSLTPYGTGNFTPLLLNMPVFCSNGDRRKIRRTVLRLKDCSRRFKILNSFI